MRHAARMLALGLCSVFLTCAASRSAEPQPPTQVLFVCERGNVKSLMAASYFNQAAQARGWPFRAVSRGSAPQSDTAPDFIKSQLTAEGFDVSSFRAAAVTATDVSAADLVVTIGTALPASASAEVSKIEEWNDIPPVSSDYTRSRAALKARVAELLERLQRSKLQSPAA